MHFVRQTTLLALSFFVDCALLSSLILLLLYFKIGDASMAADVDHVLFRFHSLCSAFGAKS